LINRAALGLQAEAQVEEFLLARGWKLLARRFRRRFGEIDLIFEDRDICVFVEVRCRRDWSRGRPADTVGSGKRRRLARLAVAYLALHRSTERPCRFDVAEVLPKEGEWEVIYWQDAFRPEPPGNRSRY
jgi:putative endonuclease